jgi:release factor glutamine methyltransferase
MKYEYGGMTLDVEKDVYEPAEDSELLAESLEIAPRTDVLDMGCGCGLLAILAAKAGANVTAADINPTAVALTHKNASANGVTVKTLLSDLFMNIAGKFDLIIFNPPYLPDKDIIGGSEMWSKRDTIERFISHVGAYLKLEGTVLLLVSSLTPLNDIASLFKRNGFSAEVIAQRKVPWETLSVLRARRTL